MKALFAAVSAVLLLTACKSAPKNQDPCSHFQGSAMTMPYHIIVGKKLAKAEKKEIASLIDRTFQEVDQTFNNWNPNSEISRLNQASASIDCLLSKPLLDMLTLCDRIVALSGGRFDPTVEPLCRLWETSFASSSAPSPEEQQELSDAIGWQHISLHNGLFRKDNAMTKLDLGAVAKGLCVDWIAERLLSKGYTDLFVEWSGEIRTAGKPPDAAHWQVKVDPSLRMHGKPIAPIDIDNAALAISGDCKQKKWHLKTADGKNRFYFHIIDPLQAQPLEKTEYSIAAVTVIAPTCALADALATAAMVFSTRKEAESWAREVIELYPQVSFWILAYDIK